MLHVSQQGLDEGLKSPVLGGESGECVWSPCRPAPDSVPHRPTRRVGDIDQKLKHALAEAERLRSQRIPRGTPLSPDSRPPGLGKEPRCPGDQVQVPASSHGAHSQGRAAARSPGRRFGGEECRFSGEKPRAARAARQPPEWPRSLLQETE